MNWYRKLWARVAHRTGYYHLPGIREPRDILVYRLRRTRPGEGWWDDPAHPEFGRYR